MSGRPSRAIDWWIERPSIDLLGAIGIGTVAAGIDPTHLPRAVDHGGFYQTLTGLSAALLSLGTLALTLILTVTPTDRLERVRHTVGRRLQALILRSLTALVFTTVGFTALFVVEAEAAGRPLQATAAALVAMTLLSFGRIWWLLARILEAFMVGSPGESEATEADWQKPSVRSRDYKIAQRNL